MQQTELQILHRLSESPLMEGPEIMELTGGDFEKARGALNHLVNVGVIKIKGDYTGENELYYSTIISSPFKVKRALG